MLLQYVPSQPVCLKTRNKHGIGMLFERIQITYTGKCLSLCCLFCWTYTRIQLGVCRTDQALIPLHFAMKSDWFLVSVMWRHEVVLPEVQKTDTLFCFIPYLININPLPLAESIIIEVCVFLCINYSISYYSHYLYRKQILI